MLKKLSLAFTLCLLPVMALFAAPLGRAPQQLTVGTCSSVSTTDGTFRLPIVGPGPHKWWFTASTTAGTGSLTYQVEGSDDGLLWISVYLTPSTLSLNTTGTADALTDWSIFIFYRLNCTAISGTGASGTLKVTY